MSAVAERTSWGSSCPRDSRKRRVWHKTADEILDSVASYCQRISDSGD
jgi:hypothetical protein